MGSEAVNGTKLKIAQYQKQKTKLTNSSESPKMFFWFHDKVLVPCPKALRKLKSHKRCTKEFMDGKQL